jgi:hypothetical protein
MGILPIAAAAFARLSRMVENKWRLRPPGPHWNGGIVEDLVSKTSW